MWVSLRRDGGRGSPRHSYASKGQLSAALRCAAPGDPEAASNGKERGGRGDSVLCVACCGWLVLVLAVCLVLYRKREAIGRDAFFTILTYLGNFRTK